MFIIVYMGIWKAADKYTGHKIWSVLSKFAVLIVTIRTVISILGWLNVVIIRNSHLFTEKADIFFGSLENHSEIWEILLKFEWGITAYYLLV
jgi:hypothetical protein